MGVNSYLPIHDVVPITTLELESIRSVGTAKFISLDYVQISCGDARRVQLPKMFKFLNFKFKNEKKSIFDNDKSNCVVSLCPISCVICAVCDK